MAVGLGPLGRFFHLDGLEIATAATGSRYQGRDDLLLFGFPEGTTHAACFTQNAFAAAPVKLAREHLATGAPRYWLVNAGNANAATGAQGLANAQKLCGYVADSFDCDAQQVAPFSTGVIGEQLPLEHTNNAFAESIAALNPAQADETLWGKAAHAIMTTDTVPKGVSVRVPMGANSFVVSGIAKGSGMICPNMATMLAFIVTDLTVSRPLLQQTLTSCLAGSFNAISVDGDTSTNDAVALAALGTSKLSSVDDSPKLAREFNAQLQGVCDTLAQMIVRDGEGITRFVCIEVAQAVNKAEAERVARSVGHSPLVKTALSAGDPNWGRIAGAIGNAGVTDLDTSKVEIWMDDLCIMRGGVRDPDYTEEQGQCYFAPRELWLRLVLGRGEADYRFFTTDLSHEYISINADYRS